MSGFSYIPTVVEKNGFGERVIDLVSKLHDDRIILINGEVDEHMAALVTAQLLQLDAKETKDIHLYINSYGGSVHAGLAIIDTMEHIESDVVTICSGYAMSMGASILACGTPGKRFSLPRARIMIHEVSSGSYGRITDMKVDVKETDYLNGELMKLLAERTGQTLEKVAGDCQRDLFMSAKEALEYGLIDEVVLKRKDMRD